MKKLYNHRRNYNDNRKSREKGCLGERIAADFLVGQGYEILEMNFTCRVGEIDIVAFDDSEIVFVEVKSRHSAGALNPIHAIDKRKQAKIIKAANVYLNKHYTDMPPSRFDVAIVTMNPGPEVELIPNAFDAQCNLW